MVIIITVNVEGPRSTILEILKVIRGWLHYSNSVANALAAG